MHNRLNAHTAVITNHDRQQHEVALWEDYGDGDDDYGDDTDNKVANDGSGGDGMIMVISL